MPITLKRLEYGIYHLYQHGKVGYSDFIKAMKQADAYKASDGERHQVFIMERELDAELTINFKGIRQFAAMQDIRKHHYLHVDTGTAIRIFVSDVNRISALNIELAPNMATARILARDILSRYTQPRPKK